MKARRYAPKNSTLQERLAFHSDRRGGSTSCWPWLGAIDKDGYGFFKRDGKQTRAHRTSWECVKGAIPVGVSVLHRCNTPACINPAHLFLGTQADAIAARGAKHRDARGENHGLAKLTADRVRAIRADSRHQRVIARSHQVAQATVSSVRLRKTWTHL